jgi:hypothetical protein
MVRAIVYFLVATVLFGTIAAPGLAAFALVAVPLLGLGLLWRLALTVSTHGRPLDAVVHTRKRPPTRSRGARRLVRRLPSR